MTHGEFRDTFAPCCKGERNCGRFNVGDRVTFDGGADVYSVRAYTGTVTSRVGVALTVHMDEWGATSGMHVRRARHLKERDE